MKKDKASILWFRQDLRLADNPALTAAAKSGTVLPIYILDDENAGEWQIGAANKAWLHHSLDSLQTALDGNLSFFRGCAYTTLQRITHHYDVEGIFWNRCYEPWCIKRDTYIKATLQSSGIPVETYNGSLLWEPWAVKKAEGTPYRVFSSYFYKGCENASPPREPLPKPKNIKTMKAHNSVSLDALSLLPKENRWDKQMLGGWQVGEAGAMERLTDFLETGIEGYKAGRNIPSKSHVSRLSPYLQTGEISPNTVWYHAGEAAESADLKHFRSELGWREFSYYLLYHFPTLPETNHQSKFDRFPWIRGDVGLKAWQRGQTGIPIIDAGMRELWQTGYMHNRVRMIVASFLVKNLLIHWREGQKWFWDTLVDADLANNSASWQWVAGSGADAAPYFRIFNPITQAQKFDPSGTYIRRYVPELAYLPDKHLFSPWEAPAGVLEIAGVKLGTSYPFPITDIKASRAFALEAFQSLNQGP